MWTGLSWFWSESPPRTILELERTVLYLGGVLALLLVVRRRSFGAALGGLLAADVALCGHALATRLVPDHVTSPTASLGFRLAGVFAYPNALGITAVLGLLLAVGFVADSQRVAVRAAAAATTVPLALALYLSNSRGAWIALAVGLAAAVALTPARRQIVRPLVLLATVGALAIWLVSRSRPVTEWNDPLAAVHDGHLLAAATVALAVSAAAISAGRSRRMMLAALVAAALAVVVAPSSPSPVTLAAAAPSGPIAPGAPEPGTTPTGRLFSTTSNSRREYWRVAMIDFRDHPIAGSGAGTFVREWYEHRRIRADVQDAHSLYLETLAELGVIGLGLLLWVLAVPVLAATRIRGKPFAAGAFGAYVAFAAHAAVDWDWELPAVTFGGIFCGALLIVAARSERVPFVLDGRRRSSLLVLVLALLTVSFVGLVGNQAEAEARAAASRSDWKKASEKARRASTWAPWSGQALVLQADAALAQDDMTAARSLLRRAVRADPHDSVLWARLALVTNGEESRLAHERATMLNPLG